MILSGVVLLLLCQAPRSREAEHPAGDAAKGAQLYRQNCALCHGPNGNGRGMRRAGMSRSPRDFTDPNWQERMSDQQIAAAIRNGVKGTAMPAWRALEPAEIENLVAFLRTLKRP